MREYSAGLLLWLRSFERIADMGGMSRAAEALFLTPSALSQHIRNLEAELGVTLFRRERGRSICLTPAGEALLKPARDILLSLGGLHDAMRPYVAEGPAIHFAVLPGMFRQGLEAAEEFRKQHAATIHLQASSSDSARTALLEGELDMAVIYRHSARPPLHWEPLCRSPLMLVTPARSSEAKKKGPVLRLDELRQLPPPLFTSGRNSPGHELFLQAGVAPGALTHLDSSLLALDMIRAGKGAVIVAAASLPEDRTDLAARPLGPDFPGGEIGLGRANGIMTPMAEEFRRFLHQAWNSAPDQEE